MLTIMHITTLHTDITDESAGVDWSLGSRQHSSDHPKGSTALHIACRSQSRDVAVWLIHRMPQLIEKVDETLLALPAMSL